MAFSESAACFVAIPSGDTFAPVRKAVIEALEEFQVKTLDPLDISETGQVSANELIERADFVIADASGANKMVLYELGVASGLRKPTLVMIQDTADLPIDLSLQRPLIYRPEEVSKLAAYLRYWIPDAIALQRKKNISSWAV